MTEIPTGHALHELTPAETAALAEEIRARILTAVSANGGHLASNLGVVEATLALHRVFRIPEDTLVFDVGHQCYAHKILTGRADEMDTLRRPGGLSGFPNREESDADPFTTGHSGTSLSAALGIAEANRLAGRDNWTVAFIGDGSFGNGMIYEALNGCARRGLKLMIVLNDNEMSISKNEGALPDYFAKIRTSRGYFAFKHAVHRFCRHIPLLGRPMISLAIFVKEFIKRVLNKKNIFENFGLEYLGPIDGHDLPTLESVFREAKGCDVPCVVHIVTKKGKGYLPAEEHPENYHAVSPFSLVGEGISRGFAPAAGGFSAAFGDAMLRAARQDDKVCAVTAAMRDGTGLAEFSDRFPDRFFDVGIAEEHAVTFAAGLARAGMRPVVALYSTFAQRAFDQVLHDVALQKLPIVFAWDRCGLIPGDGVTHQGLFDVGLFTPIPGITVYSPLSCGELADCLTRAFKADAPTVLRYPRGGESAAVALPWQYTDDGTAAALEYGTGNPSVLLVTYGSETAEGIAAAEAMASRIPVRVLRLVRIAPLPADVILAAADGVKAVCVAEEGMRRGGIGEEIAALLPAYPIRICAVNGFVPHGTTAGDLPISAEDIAEAVREML